MKSTPTVLMAVCIERQRGVPGRGGWVHCELVVLLHHAAGGVGVQRQVHHRLRHLRPARRHDVRVDVLGKELHHPAVRARE